MALRVFGDADVAEDVAQETISRALTAIRGGETQINHLGAFVHGIARYVIADILRARATQSPSGELPETAATTPDPLAAAVTAEERERVHAALARLSSADRALLRLSFFEGLTPAEVGQRIGEPSTRVRKRKSRALERLRQVFVRSFGHDTGANATEDEERGKEDTRKERR